MSAMNVIWMIISQLAYIAILVAIIWGIVKLVRRSGQPHEVLEDTAALQGSAVTVERVVIYVLAFAGLMAVLFALATLASLAFYPFWPDASRILSPNDAKTTASISIAALLVGAPIWLGLWHVAQRRLARSLAERETVERRLFLSGVFAVTSIIAMFALSGTITAIFMLMTGEGDHNAYLKDLMSAATRALVYGVAWWYYARLWWREHDRRALNWTHDLALYLVTALGGVLLLSGLTDAGREIINEIQSTNGNTLIGHPALQTWEGWGTALGETLAGGAVLAAALRYDFRRGRARIMRVIGLYTMLLFLVPTTIISSTTVVGETLRRVFGFEDFSAASDWSFLENTLPWTVFGACFWLAIWLLVRREAYLQGAPAQVGVIRYPRRPAIAVLDLIGLGMAGFGLVAGLWVVIDALLTTHSAVDGGGWWWELTSWSLAVGGIGATIWMPAWTLLQHASARNPEYERARWERRWLLSGVTLGATLIVIGFTVALLYQILRGVLSATDANTLSDALRFLTAAVVTGAIAAYHGLVLRRETLFRAAVPRTVKVRVMGLLTPGAEHTLQELEQRTGRTIEIAGYVTTDDAQPTLHLHELEERLMTLGTEGSPSRALLLLRADGGQIIPYSQEKRAKGTAEISAQPEDADGGGTPDGNSAHRRKQRGINEGRA